MSRSRSLLVPSILTLLGLAVLIGLGTWQLERLHWKNDLIARVEARTKATALTLPPADHWGELDLAEWEYQPVEVTGRFRHDLEVRVYTVLSEPKGPRRGQGYWILTPLETEGGQASVIVNRGFVPLDRAEPSTRTEGQVKGPVNIRGLLRAPEQRNLFTPDDEPAKHLFFVRDPAAIAKAEGLEHAAPFTLDAFDSAPGGLPQGGETRLTFPNRHLEYALTWYGLALGLVGVFIAFAIPRLRSQGRPA